MRVAEIPEFGVRMTEKDGVISQESELCKHIEDDKVCRAIEDIILAHFESGVDIAHPDYREGLGKAISGLT